MSSLDYEITREYSLVVTATDGGSPPLSASTVLIIAVADGNDNSPVFSRTTYTASIPENSVVGLFVTIVEATDADSGANGELSYSIVGSTPSSTFSIESSSGVVRVQRNDALDFETSRTLALQVRAQDSGVPPMSSQALVSCSW